MKVVRSVNMHDMTSQYYRLDVAGTGFTVLDKIYQDGELSEEALGGSCANVLVSLAMLNRHVAPVLRLGDDDEGERLISEFSDAGAVIDFIHRHNGLRSPVLAEQIDTRSAEHVFSFRCPETDVDLPTYESIGLSEFNKARTALTRCTVFYTDRLSRSILDAMRLANNSGALVVFEPSAIQDPTLFSEALELTAVLKSSVDRLDDELSEFLHHATSLIRITTHGIAGLEISDATTKIWCEAEPATEVRDACGSGDMVSIGLIDRLLSETPPISELSAEHLLDGVKAGQRLAAENCAYEGARGLFRSRGAGFARSILSQVPETL